MRFNDWCNIQELQIGDHSLRVLSGKPTELQQARDTIASIIPEHYVAADHIARALSRLGKSAAAKLVTQKLPTTKQLQSGDLGEILATEYIANQTEYKAPIKRLRWKDHRNMAMRGDDVIGIVQDKKTARLRFLKTESKSRKALSASVVAEAREALDKDDGLPSPHALSFISARLLELGNTSLADAIDDTQLKSGISQSAVKHLLFTFSGNNPTNYLQPVLQSYSGNIQQLSVGVNIQSHSDFIANVYKQVGS